MRNFHLPLPEDVYSELRVAAERSKQPATRVAREAIELWLRENRRAARHHAIAEFAAESAGTPVDLDRDLEAASIEHLVEMEREAR